MVGGSIELCSSGRLDDSEIPMASSSIVIVELLGMSSLCQGLGLCAGLHKPS